MSVKLNSSSKTKFHGILQRYSTYMPLIKHVGGESSENFIYIDSIKYTGPRLAKTKLVTVLIF